MFDFLKRKKQPQELKAMVSGEVIPVTKVKDDVFSSCMLGNGIAIHPTDKQKVTVVAPADGKITITMEGTNHAVGLRIAEGFDVLIHIGIDTISLNGKGFTSYIKTGQKVKAGEKLIEFDKSLIESRELCSDVILIALDNPELPDVTFESGMQATAGETVIATF
ncbi:glucose PTS transporter subunit IIA [Brotaphodocola catenula]|uniref:PTS glucose transporter subunit IIA n=1 Tax=Brotaphodocola catenula TaxID=2885361 RepID=A0AAE3ATH2_9FIRM|nr:glucose PTS transporter subunit IIA [Brotaphodocola catenula]MCC2165458.1 PTS glucose transporter subunit IIA [Brotaphodocola catenula]